MIVRFVLAAFACYRLSMLVAFDYGPFHIFENIRKFFGRRAVKGVVWKTIAELLHCQYCLGIWFSAFLLPFVLIENPVMTAILIFLAVPGLQALFLEITNAKKEE